jgi:5'-3' exonuclease
MGIKYLNYYIREKCSKESVKCISLKELTGKKIAVDISIYLYKYTSGNSLIENFYLMMSVFHKYNIIPIFVFDGKSRTEKKELLIKRHQDKKLAEKEYNVLKEKLEKNQDMDDVEKQEIQSTMDSLKKKFVYIQKEHIHIVKELIRSYGMTYCDAEGEADELCSLLVLKKKVWACLSEDMDMFVYGCCRVLRYLSLINHTCVLYDTKKILKEFEMNQDDFRQVCVLSGTDYNIQKCRDDDTSYDLYKVMKLFHKYLKEKETIGFYNWIEQYKLLEQDMDVLLNVYNMFDLSCANCSMDIDKIKIVNGVVDKEHMKSILKLDGFIFAY